MLNAGEPCRGHMHVKFTPEDPAEYGCYVKPLGDPCRGLRAGAARCSALDDCASTPQRDETGLDQNDMRLTGRRQ
jgi:hypothetical protein